MAKGEAKILLLKKKNRNFAQITIKHYVRKY